MDKTRKIKFLCQIPRLVYRFIIASFHLIIIKYKYLKNLLSNICISKFWNGHISKSNRKTNYLIKDSNKLSLNGKNKKKKIFIL